MVSPNVTLFDRYVFCVTVVRGVTSERQPLSFSGELVLHYVDENETTISDKVKQSIQPHGAKLHARCRRAVMRRW
jgi:hypothetical protein